MVDVVDVVDEVLPAPDLSLLRKILGHIDAHPEEWDQERYGYSNVCGSAHCVAGHAVVMTGGVFNRIGGVTGGLGGSCDAYTYAERVLGLTNEESFALFFEYNTRSMVQKIAERIAARAGERL
jgi:hypothetical protein